MKRIPHTYQIGDKIMLKKYNQNKYGSPEYEGPYAITTVNDNGTVCIQWCMLLTTLSTSKILSPTMNE